MVVEEGCELVVEELGHGRAPVDEEGHKPGPPTGATCHVLSPACLESKPISLGILKRYRRGREICCGVSRVGGVSITYDGYVRVRLLG